MSDMSAIIEKIRKLRTKAQDASLTEAEAAAFVAKVQELLAEHNLHQGVIDQSSEQEETHPIEQQFYGGPYKKMWRSSLAHSVAKMYFCKVYAHVRADKQRELVFVGKEHNRAVAIDMFQYLAGVCNELALPYLANNEEYLAFERGCGLMLAQRISDHTALLRAGTDHAGGGIPALYNNELGLVDGFMAGIALKKSGHKHDLTSAAAQAGMRAGEGIQFGNQVTGKKAGAFLIGR